MPRALLVDFLVQTWRCFRRVAAAYKESGTEFKAELCTGGYDDPRLMLCSVHIVGAFCRAAPKKICIHLSKIACQHVRCGVVRMSIGVVLEIGVSSYSTAVRLLVLG